MGTHTSGNLVHALAALVCPGSWDICSLVFEYVGASLNSLSAVTAQQPECIRVKHEACKSSGTWNRNILRISFFIKLSLLFVWIPSWPGKVTKLSSISTANDWFLLSLDILPTHLFYILRAAILDAIYIFPWQLFFCLDYYSNSPLIFPLLYWSNLY